MERGIWVKNNGGRLLRKSMAWNTFVLMGVHVLISLGNQVLLHEICCSDGPQLMRVMKCSSFKLAYKVSIKFLQRCDTDAIAVRTVAVMRISSFRLAGED